MPAIRRRDCVSWLIVLTTCLSSWGLAQDAGGEKTKPKPAFVPKITNDRTIQRMQNLEVAFALSAWRSEHDSYPQSLAELAPKYLAAAPIDHFTDQPLRYEPTPDGYRFYSLGANGKDDDGRSFDDAPAGDDQIVEMPKPLPK